jgi:Na+-driven multidrug efflux pump
MLEIGTVALRTISFSFLFAGFNIISTSFYQALGHGFLSLAGAVLRQLVVLLPVAILMAKIQGLSAVWLAFPAAEISTLVFNIFFVRYIYRKELRTMPKKETPEMA